MRKQPVTRPAGAVTVLSISPRDENHSSVEAILGHSTWILFKASDLVSAKAVLQRHEIGVVLCARDLPPGTWIDVLEQINVLPNAPSLIVASKLADDRLWAEALNLGAWDVLATPFEPSELIRSVTSGWQRWHGRIR